MNECAIGVFDSGLGGLTCVKELNRILPNENIVYFGDTARVPYGTRSRETIMEYAEQDINFIKKHNAKLIIAACGTVSSVLGADKKNAGNIPFTGVLLPTAQTACKITKNGRIGVIGTPATINSGAYVKAIKNIRPDVSVTGNACPLFVPLVEYGFTGKDDPIVKLAVEKYLAPIKACDVDVLILGCTHYPMIKDAISEYMGSSVSLISSSGEAAKYALALLTEKNMLSGRSETGKNVYYTSDSIELFEENAHAFLGDTIGGEVHKVGIDELISAAQDPA